MAPIKKWYTSMIAESGVSEERRKILDYRAKRLQLIVFAALFAFSVLAAYGFVLIYNLSRDIHNMSSDIAMMTVVVDKAMASMVGSMDNMDNHIGGMSGTMSLMQININKMDGSLTSMTESVNTMNGNITVMAHSMDGMKRDMGSLNYNVSKPLSFFNNMVPWSP